MAAAGGGRLVGYGDELMAAGQAWDLYCRTGRTVRILDKAGAPRSHLLWKGMDCIRPDGDMIVVNGSGCRPYIDYAATKEKRWFFRLDHRAIPAPWANDDGYDRRSVGRILVEPHIKPSASPNKQWGRWQELIDLAPALPWAQVGPKGTPRLRGVEFIETATFEDAMTVARSAMAAVLPEGGLHHARASCGSTVVLFGGFMPAQVTGYPFHENLWVNDPDAVGWRVRHPACERAWSQITPQRVLAALEDLL